MFITVLCNVKHNAMYGRCLLGSEWVLVSVDVLDQLVASSHFLIRYSLLASFEGFSNGVRTYLLNIQIYILWVYSSSTVLLLCYCFALFSGYEEVMSTRVYASHNYK